MKQLVIGSIIISIIASILFYGQNLGASVILFAIAALIAVYCFLEKGNKIKNRKAYFFTIPIILLASTYFIYNQAFFKIANIIVIFFLFAIMLLVALQEKEIEKSFLAKIGKIIFYPLNYLGDAIKGIGNTIIPKRKEVKKENKKLKQIWIGIGISLPILFVVLMLLSSADLIFAQGMENVKDGIFKGIGEVLTSNFLVHLIARILFIFITTVYFVSLMLNLWDENLLKQNEKACKISIETTILNTLVTILNIVYAIFCTIQITTLFAKITPNDFNYAEYARQGFFQLVIISIINFAIILMTTMNQKEASKGQITYRKIMNILLTMFTVIILMSAFMRMNLYQQEYGYTFLRIFVDFAIVTEALLFIPTLIYIVKPNFHPLKSYFIIIITMYIAMNFSNIGHFIAKENVNRYLKNEKDFQRGIDFYYLSRTKTDGIEEVLRLYENTENEALKKKIEQYLYQLKTQLKEENIIEWNYSRWNARNLLTTYNLPI